MAAIDLFRTASDGESFSAGATIGAAGDPGDAMYVVQDGQLDVVAGDTLLETLGPGAIGGEMVV